MVKADPTLLRSCWEEEEVEEREAREETVKSRTGGETPHRRRKTIWGNSKHEDVVWKIKNNGCSDRLNGGWGGEKMSWSRKEMLGGKTRGRIQRGERGQRGVWEECARGRERGSVQEGFQLRSLHSDLIWPVCLGYTQRFHKPPPIPPISCPCYTSNRKRSHVMPWISPALSTNTCAHRNAHELAHTDTRRHSDTRGEKPWAGKINILVLTLHLPVSVFPMEEETDTDRANVKTEGLKVQT